MVPIGLLHDILVVSMLPVLHAPTHILSLSLSLFLKIRKKKKKMRMGGGGQAAQVHRKRMIQDPKPRMKPKESRFKQPQRSKETNKSPWKMLKKDPSNPNGYTLTHRTGYVEEKDNLSEKNKAKVCCTYMET